MQKNITQYPEHFVSYPTHRVSGLFNTVKEAEAAVKTLVKAGYEKEDMYILHGEKGIKALDPDGDEHGFWAKISRMLHAHFSDTESSIIEELVEHLHQGKVGMAVHAYTEDEREYVKSVMQKHNGFHLVYYAHLYIEDLDTVAI